MIRTFISYSRVDIDFVKTLVTEIEEVTLSRPWYDLDGIETGSHYDDVITRHIDECDRLIFVISPHSIESPYVKKEVKYALKKHKTIYPIIIGKVNLDDGWVGFEFGGIDCIDYDNAEQKKKFFRNLKDAACKKNVPVDRPCSLFAVHAGFVVCAESGGHSPLVANRQSGLGTWETFVLTQNVDGSFSLKSLANGKYVSARPLPDGHLVPEAPEVDAWEKFDLKTVPGKVGTFTLWSRFLRKYVSVDENEGNVLIANRDVADAWEEFRIVDLLKKCEESVPVDRLCSLFAVHAGFVVCAESGGRAPLVANRQNGLGTWETFVLTQNVDDSFSLKSLANGKYVSARPLPDGHLVPEALEVDAWEKFDLKTVPGKVGTFTLWSRFLRKYVSVDENEGNVLIANRDVADAWEEFRIVCQ